MTAWFLCLVNITVTCNLSLFSLKKLDPDSNVFVYLQGFLVIIICCIVCLRIYLINFVIYRDKVVDFHWNASDPWTVVSVSDDCDTTGGGGTLQVSDSFPYVNFCQVMSLS